LAAGGLQVAETNVDGMETKGIERSETLQCNEGEMSKAASWTKKVAPCCNKGMEEICNIQTCIFIFPVQV